MGILYIKNAEGKFVAIPSLTGEDGYSPTVLENEENTENIYKLDIQTKNEKFTTPNLKGEEGFSPIIKESVNNTDEIYQLDIETADGKFTTPNLKGNGVEAPTEEYKYSVKVIGTIGASYYSTGISLDQITSVYETGSPITGLYGGWTIDSVESDDTSIADFANFSNYTDTNIISENVTVYNLFALSAREAAGTTYSITYQWNEYQKKATITYTSIEELESIKGITIDRDTEDMCASILANLKSNEELVLNGIDNIGFGINSTVYGNIINKIVFYVGGKGSVIAFLKNGAIATRVYSDEYLYEWNFSLTNIDTYVTYHSVEDLERRKDINVFFVNEEPDTKIKAIFNALDWGEKFFLTENSSTKDWGMEGSEDISLCIFQIIKYNNSNSERGCVFALDSRGNLYIKNIYHGILDSNWTINPTTEIDDSIVDKNKTWSSSKISQSIDKTYNNLFQMGLTSDATIDDIMRTLEYGESAILQITSFSNKEQFLNERGGVFICRKCGPSVTDVELWLNTLKGKVYCGSTTSDDFYRWDPITLNLTAYDAVWEFGGYPENPVASNAKKMNNYSIVMYAPDSYKNQEQGLNLISPLITIVKLDENHCNITMLDKDTETLYYGIPNENGVSEKWIKVGGGVSIDDTTVSTDSTWSSEKITNDYSTKEYVAEQIANASHLKREIVTAIPEADAAQENTIYMFKVESVLGDDKYQEWQLINGEMVLIGDTSVDLSGYAKTYTTLSELGLIAPVTVGDIFNAMSNDTMAVIACEDTTEHITDVPMHYGILTIKKSAVGRFSIDFQNSLASSPCNVKKWIGTLKGDDGTGLYWREVAYKENLSIYKSLSELGLDTTATLKDITRAMAKSSMIAIKVDAMANQSEYNNITQGTVTIYKIEDARIQAIMTEKSTGRTWVGILGGENTIIGWKELRSDVPYHRIITQGAAGYFKFKPTSTGIDQSLRISVTDNYGGMINISGATPSATQYKPFKCIRLSNGTYADYDAIKTTNNKMEKLYFYDGYFYLKVVSYTTCTFTGLTEAPTYVETFDNTVAEEIPIRSVFDIPYNDGYADPGIIAIGDAASADGVIKTLDSLGFTTDIMTWDTGEYRISHVAGLTNLPTEIIEEKPGFRLAHYDVKKWGSNHNPYVSTYGCRQSVLHYKGNVFVRYTESGATAGVLIADTGWKKIQIGNTKETLAFNSKTFKIDITKGREAWNGNIKFGYCVDNSYGEIIISSLGATKVTWSCSEGVHYVKSVTYTIDPDNKAHVTIGVELHDIVYGVHQLETSGDFATINSFTGDAFTGTSVAERQGIRGRNNGVGILCEVADLGLTTPCTTVQIAQAMKNLSNYIGRIPTSGMIGIFDNGGNTITDAPSEYGLLTINAYGYDRVMIRYDGIGSSTYAGSWIGQIVGSSGTFSEVTWSKIAFEGESSGDVAWTTATVNSGIGYATNNSGGYTTKYAIKNNVVYINSNIKCNTVKEGGYDTLISGLPAPSTNLFFTLQPDAYGNAPITIQIDTNGNLKLRSGTAGKTYMLSISYPII